MNIKIVAAFLLMTIALGGCRTAPLQVIESEAFVTPAVSSPRVLTADDYKNAIIRAGANRGWSFAEESPGNLIGTINIRSKHSAKVRVLFDQTAFSILYIDSSQLNYDAETGQIHPNYNKWVLNLRRDIQAEITRTKAS